jgi:glycosyltransferase involved in cell wall biosynthesis
MDTNLLSVIVRTTGSNLSLLKKSLLSIENSDYKNIEIILVYQGIDFDKFDLIKKFNLSVNYTALINEVTYDDRSKNLNIGIANSKGTFLAFLDDDDFVAKNHYSNLINKLTKEKSSLAYCLCNIVNKKGEILDDIFKDRYLDKLSFLKDNFITIHSFVLNKNSIENSLLHFKEDLRLAEDYIFILPIYIKYKTSYVPERTSYYLIPENESNSYVKYKNNNEFKNQRKIMKTYRRQTKINIIEKAIIHYNRITGKTEKI